MVSAMHGKSVQAVVEDLRVHELLELVHDVRRRRGVTLNELCGRVRSQNAAIARQELWWRIRHHPERRYSLPEIARLFGRDHTTVRAGLLAHQRRQLHAPLAPSMRSRADDRPLSRT